MKYLFVALLFTACAVHPKNPAVHDTAALQHNLTTAHASLSDADYSAVSAGGHIKAARDLGTQSEGKDALIERWIEARP